MAVWTGRFDGDTPEHLRIFQKISTLPYADILVNQQSQSDSYIIIGFCCDEGVRRNKGRIGAKNAPDTVRTALAPLPYINSRNTTATYSITDGGDVSCDNNQLEDAQNRLAQALQFTVKNNHTTIVIGGGHETAFGCFKGLHDHYPTATKIGIINFDAHFDLRTTNDNSHSSGTPFYNAHTLCQQTNRPFKYFCMGVAQCGNTQILFNRAEAMGVEYVYDRECNLNPQWAIEKLQTFARSVDVLYITIDMDTFNAGIAPGVSALNPLGLHPTFVEQCIITLIQTNKPIATLDVVEINPLYDTHAITAKLGARLIHTFLTHNCNG